MLRDPIELEPHPTLGCSWHKFELVEGTQDTYISYMAGAIRNAYIDSARLAEIVRREGFPGAVEELKERFPSARAPFGVQKGDFGEVVGHTVLTALLGYDVPVVKLRYKTNWEKAAFGIDIIAFRFHQDDPGQDRVAFSEVKTSSDREYGVEDVFEEIDELEIGANDEAKQKMRNAVRFVSDRLYERKEFDLETRVYRFLDCISNPQFIEGFYPFLVREKRNWDDAVLDKAARDGGNRDRVFLYVFLIEDLEKVVAMAYERAAQVEF